MNTIYHCAKQPEIECSCIDGSACESCKNNFITKYIALTYDFQEERDVYIVKFLFSCDEDELRTAITDITLKLSAEKYEEEDINADTFLKYFLAEHKEVTAEIVYSFTIDDMSNILHTDEPNLVEM